MIKSGLLAFVRRESEGGGVRTRTPDRRTAEGRGLTKRQRLERVNDLPTHGYILDAHAVIGEVLG